MWLAKSNMGAQAITNTGAIGQRLRWREGGARVVIVEDDASVAATVHEGLRAAGFAVWVARTGADALDLWQKVRPDAIVLDLALPDMDGLDVCSEIRRADVVPLIIASGRREEADRVCGLELGADDYLCKPYEVGELVSRLRALLSRCRRYQGRHCEADYLSAGELIMDRSRHEAVLGGRRLDLTPKEFDLLWVLAREAGRTMSARQLLWEVWGYDESIHTRTLDVHIGRLRRKLGDDPARPFLIVTVPSVGYRFEAPTQSAMGVADRTASKGAARSASHRQDFSPRGLAASDARSASGVPYPRPRSGQPA